MVTYPRIKFECEVNGRELIAEVVTRETSPGQFNFAAKFSDGFEDTFIHEERSGLWKAIRDKKSAYLEKIKDDLSALVAYQIDRHYLSFRHCIGKEIVNIWVFETEWENRSAIYTVYYKGEYQFEMKKIYGAWYAWSVRPEKNKNIDDALVAKIGVMIETKIRV
jgi:hypothetical protein